MNQYGSREWYGVSAPQSFDELALSSCTRSLHRSSIFISYSSAALLSALLICYKNDDKWNSNVRLLSDFGSRYSITFDERKS